MGFDKAFAFKDAARVFDEFVWLTRGRVCNYSGVNHTRLQKEGPLQWPVPNATDPGTLRLYYDKRFPTDNGRAKFFVPIHKEPDEEVNAEYPFVLTTGRLPTQWHTMTRTGKSAQLMKGNEEPFVEIHPVDAAKQGIESGQLIKINSRRGTAVVQAVITDRIKEGTIFIPFHWGRLSGHSKAANNLTTDAVDPISKEPEFKACAVNMVPIKLPELDSAPVPVNGTKSRQYPLAAD
jgi:ferredoxin-nitrate reductase